MGLCISNANRASLEESRTGPDTGPVYAMQREVPKRLDLGAFDKLGTRKREDLTGARIGFAYVPGSSKLTLPRVPDAQATLALAGKLLLQTRNEVYKLGFKSSNKIRFDVDMTAEQDRLERADAEIAITRSQPSLGEARLAALEARGHNCVDLAFVVQAFAERSGHTATLCAIGQDHAFAIIGTVPHGSMLSKNMTKWPADLAICDPWANIACLAKDYPEKFREKMAKWVRDNKRISNNEGDIFSPMEKKWLKAVLDGKKVTVVDRKRRLST